MGLHHYLYFYPAGATDANGDKRSASRRIKIESDVREEAGVIKFAENYNWRQNDERIVVFAKSPERTGELVTVWRKIPYPVGYPKDEA